MEEQKKIIIAGAGASGMMAAIAAARSGASVTILEAMERPGRKLLLTGNGRCNLTNLEKNLPEAYYGTGKEHAASVIRKMDAEAVCSLFAELGLLTAEKNGYVYPYTGQASSVLEVLLAELRRLKVKLKLNEKVESIIRPSDGGWLVKTATWQYPADAVILACGSCAAPATGSDGSGYGIAQQAGHRIIKPSPALVSVCCKEEYLPQLAGVRCRAKVSLLDAESRKVLNADTGELQWTRYGVSGIVVFQLSRFISSADGGRKFFFSVDLFPDHTEDILRKLLRSRASHIQTESLSTLLGGFLNEKLVPVILQLAEAQWSDRSVKEQTDRQNKNSTKNGKKNRKGSRPFLCQDLTEEKIHTLVRIMKDLRLQVTETKSFDTAQVCAGGVDAAEIFMDTMESKIHQNLYFTGELVDTDGPCGGYNLQWAWSSGWIAGKAAAKKQL